MNLRFFFQVLFLSKGFYFAFSETDAELFATMFAFEYKRLTFAVFGFIKKSEFSHLGQRTRFMFQKGIYFASNQAFL